MRGLHPGREELAFRTAACQAVRPEGAFVQETQVSLEEHLASNGAVDLRLPRTWKTYKWSGLERGGELPLQAVQLLYDTR